MKYKIISSTTPEPKSGNIVVTKQVKNNNGKNNPFKMRIQLLTTLILFLYISGTAFAQNIFRTACQGKMERLDSLLSPGSIDTIDYRGRTLLHWAVGCKKRAIFDYLIVR